MLTFQQFLLRQPSYPQETSTDSYYYDLALRLIGIWEKSGLMTACHESVRERVILCLIGYYQDVIADAGIFHAFVDEHERLYGRKLPFYETDEDYMDYELNYPDVRFMLWYGVAMLDENLRQLNPLDADLELLSRQLYDELERVYDESPMPEDYRKIDELEMHAPEDTEQIMDFSHWLFMHCYLMTPAFALTLNQIVSDPEVLADKEMNVLRERMEEAMSSLPTGPLALFLREWTYLIIDKKLPREKREERPESKMWRKFTEATGGEEMKIFKSYAELNRFLIDSMGWDDVEHFDHLKDSHDFILLVNREKGMLLARNVARCIAAPGNDLYDRAYASEHAIDMLTVRGFCPCDLVKYAVRHGWLPDAHFPGAPDTHELVDANWDFIARCYLQLYYRD